ncbi:MAG: hypothetical protein AB7O32_02040, partial [Vicinamibacterales bacterium]
RSLAAIAERNPHVRVPRPRIEEVVLHEVSVGRPIWNGRRMLDGLVSESPFDAFVKDRASQSLAHVFTLLSLVLPRDPIQIAFRSLSSQDRRLRGTAVEYLEEVLPPAIRNALWPHLMPEPVTPAPQPRAAVVSELLRASQSVTLLNLARQERS